MDWTKDKVGGRPNAPRLSDLAQMFDLSDGQQHTGRAIGPARRQAKHWFRVRKEDGSTSKPFPKMCLSYNSETGDFDGECPYCDLGNRAGIEVVQNFIDRDVQEDIGPKIKKKPPVGSEKKIVDHYGFKCRLKSSKDSGSITPVRLAVLGGAASRKVGDLAEMNTVKTENGKKMFGPEHPKHGFDIVFKYDKNRQGSERHIIMKSDKTPLEEEEREYLLWPLDLEKPEPLKVAQKEAESLADRMVEEDDDKKGGKKKNGGGKPQQSKSRKIDADDDDEDEDGGWGDDDDKPKSKSKKRRDDDDDDDDDEDEKPKSKKRRPVDDDEDDDEDERPKSKKKRSRDEDEDEDDEDEKPRGKSKKRRDDDEDEDDEPKSKKKSKKSSDWDDDEDDEDEKPAKKKRRASDDDDDEDERPAKKKKRSSDDDEDEDDEPKSKKKSKKSSSWDDDEDERPKAKSKKKPADDDDDDGDDDWDDEDDD